MFNQNVNRVGFACQFNHHDQTLKKKLLEEIQRPLREKTTTITWLNNQTVEVAEQRLWDLMVHNVESYKKLISFVSTLQKELHMVRLGSMVLPGYSEHKWQYFWKKPDVVSYLEKHPPLILISWAPTWDGIGKSIINSFGQRPGQELGRLIIISAAERRDGKQILIWRRGSRDGIGKFNY